MDGVWTSASRKRGSLGTRALLLPESTKARPRTSFRGQAPPHQMTARGRPRRRRGRRPASRRSGASTPDACGALTSRARPRSSSPGTPRRQAPARGRPRRRRERRLRLGLDVLRHRDKGVEVGALDAVLHAPTKPVSTTCERAASTAWSARANALRQRLGVSRRCCLRVRRRPRGTACAERRRRLRSVVDARAVPGPPASRGSPDIEDTNVS